MINKVPPQRPPRSGRSIQNDIIALMRSWADGFLGGGKVFIQKSRQIEARNPFPIAGRQFRLPQAFLE